MRKIILTLFGLFLVVGSYAQYKHAINKPENFIHKLKVEEKLKKLTSTPETEKLYFWEQDLQEWSLRKISNYTYTPNSLPDVVIENDANGNPVTRAKYHYNGNLLIVEEVDYWMNNAWQPNTKLNIYYDSNNEPIKEEILFNNNNSWEIVFGFSTYKTYDAVTSNETILDSMFTGSIYELMQKRVRHIDKVTSLVDTETLYVPSFGLLQPSQKNVIQYDAQGLPYLAIQYLWAGIDWEFDRATHEFVWDANQRLLSCVNQVWDGFGWVDIQKEENEYLIYDGFKSTVYAIQSGNLMNYQRSRYLNDSLYNQIDIKYEDWDGNKWNTLMYETSSYTYDQMENILERIEKTADSLGVLQNNVKQVYTYSGSTGVDHQANKGISVYPNPSNNFVKFNGINTNEKVQLMVFDVYGKLIHKDAITGNYILNISKFDNGVYFLTIDGVTHKLIKN